MPPRACPASRSRSVILRAWEPTGTSRRRRPGPCSPPRSGHVLPAIARAAEAIGLTVHATPQLLDLDRRARRPRPRPALPAAGPRAHRRRGRRAPGGHRSAGGRRGAHRPAAHRPDPRRRAGPPRRDRGGRRAGRGRVLGRPTSPSSPWPTGPSWRTRRCCAAWSTAARSGAATCSSSPSRPAGCRGWTASAASPPSPAPSRGWATTTSTSTSTRPRSSGRRSASPAPRAWWRRPASRRPSWSFEVVESHADRRPRPPRLGAGPLPRAGLAGGPGRRRAPAGRACRCWPPSGPTSSSWTSAWCRSCPTTAPAPC